MPTAFLPPALRRTPAGEPMLDDVFDQDSGAQEIPTAQAFAGSALRFRLGEATGAGETAMGDRIDPETGALRVATGFADPGRRVTVIAENDAGAARLPVSVTIEAGGEAADVSRRDEITVDGVTFRFAKPAPVGHFISGGGDSPGDAFVIGPVTITRYDPPGRDLPGGQRIGGAMLNPPCSKNSGFTGFAGKFYRADRDVSRRMPLTLNPGDALVVHVGHPDATKPKGATRRFVVLTCLAEPPYSDAFRPPYSGPDRPLWRLGEVDPSRLAALTPLRPNLIPPLDEMTRRFRRFVLDITLNWNRDFLATSEHPPLYGRDVCNNEADPYLWVNSAVPLEQKRALLIGLIQRGIDRFGIFRSALGQGFHPWEADGGHHAGRKFSIMFAGHLLGDETMTHVRRLSDTVKGAFQEDGTTFYVDAQTVAYTNRPNWKPPYHGRRASQPYTEAMIGVPDWRGKASIGQANAAWSHPYRIAGTHNTQHAQVLSLLAMGLREAWDHDAYFDYHFRFMDIAAGRQDPWRFRGGAQALYNPVAGSRLRRGAFETWQQYWKSPWSWAMLEMHRKDVYQPPWQT